MKELDVLHAKYRERMAIVQEQMKESVLEFIHSELEKFLTSWDNTRFNLNVPRIHLQAIHQSTSKYMKQQYIELSEEYINDLIPKLMEIENVEKKFAEKNEQVYERTSENQRNALLVVLEKLVGKVTVKINARTNYLQRDFDQFCREQREMHEDYFLRNYRKNFCMHVFCMEWPKCQAIFDQLLSILKNKYVDKMVANVEVKREDVLRELNMNPSVIQEQTTTVEVDFGNEDAKHTVFPRLQIHVVNNLADRQTITMAMLQLCELGIFDEIELELPLHGKFQLERDRAPALTRVIQNR